MIYKIVTEKDYKRNKRVIHLHEDYGNGGMADFEKIGEKEVEAFLTLTIFSETYKTINSIYELDCFKYSKMKNKSKTIIGAIAGDIIGSVYEWNNVKTTDFALFTAKSDYTDDTVLTVAIADCILNQKDFSKTVWEYGRKYRRRGYGGSFKRWLRSNNPKPYGSYGNGSAMRVCAVGFAYDTLEKVLEIAAETAKITHNHPEGIKGAQAIASAIYLANNGKSKKEIKDYLVKTFDYDLDFTLDSIRPTYKFDVTCQGSVPQAIVAFLESTDFENALRLAISIGGDSDTIACITGGIASAFYKEIPNEILEFVSSKLPNEFIEILNRFDEEKMTNAKIINQ
jgi:ADP-ribosylglycohydrolase